ncbi:MAG: alpha/beta hydrolase [Alphaproteobacteria bacterium]|nr:alpha/beta hydrolase [Alphaproteobacteria bacterium]
MSPTELATALARPGRASIPYIDPFSPDRPLVLECFRPPRHDPDKPVVIVQHGASRNGAEYCEAWVPAAERHGFLVVAITFPKESWPDAVTYNNGHVLTEDATVRPRECWSQAIPGHLFALLREAGVTTRDKFHLWGHSAGGQFVHRLLATQPHGIFAAVGAANSGWYTRPTLELPYPDGLGGIGLTQDDVVRLLFYPLVIFSGDRDIDGTTENFPKHETAMAQGSNRFERAQFFLADGQAEAARLGVPCRWTRVVVPGVAHEGMKMSAFAAQYWFAAAPA